MTKGEKRKNIKKHMGREKETRREFEVGIQNRAKRGEQ